MKDFVEAFYYDAVEEEGGYDARRAQHKAFAAVIPLLMERELTERQEVCLRYHYVYGKSQSEIAALLKLSQPTVSRHIRTAKSILNNELAYCYAAVYTALDEYDRLAG